MTLTAEQQTLVKAAIVADGALNAQPNNSDGAFAIALAFNLPASPQFVVWKGSIPIGDIGKTVNYVAVNSLTTGNNTQLQTFLFLNEIDFSPTADIRSFWASTFSGALGGQGQNTRDALEALWRRDARRIEQILATGTGTTLSPATMTFEGDISYQDVQMARNS